MAKKTKEKVADGSTEEKIKEAARKVFMKKGYGATRTRDIAEEAGINLALLNYYFRSKEKLFEIIMMEKFQKFFGIIAMAANDSSTSLDQKVEAIVDNYITMLMENKDLPIFVLSEIRHNTERFTANTQLKKLLSDSSFAKQLIEKRSDISPLQLITSLMGLTIMPFIMMPVLIASKTLNESTFEEFIEERRILIRKWFSAFLKIK